MDRSVVEKYENAPRDYIGKPPEHKAHPLDSTSGARLDGFGPRVRLTTASSFWLVRCVQWMAQRPRAM